MSWQYFDSQGRPHTKSEIEVGTDDEWTLAEMWQPATIESDDESIVYSGNPLEDGSTYYIRVRVMNDTLWSAWYGAIFRMNSLPTAPTLSDPASGVIIESGKPTLIVNNSSDAEGDDLRYDFEVHLDSNLSLLTEYITGVYEGIGQTGWTTDSLTNENLPHWWRTRASDGYENGPWSDSGMFWLNAYNEKPFASQLVVPDSGSIVYELPSQFVWSYGDDPDPGDQLTYDLIIALDSLFQFTWTITDISDTVYPWSTGLEDDRSYWWKVEAEDSEGLTTSSSSIFNFFLAQPWICGDCDSSGDVDIDDVVYLINYIFSGGPAPEPLESGDVDLSGGVDIDDVVYLIAYIFSGGPDPCAEQ